MPRRPAKNSAHFTAHRAVSKSFPSAINCEIPSAGSEGEKTNELMTFCVLVVKFLLFGVSLLLLITSNFNVIVS